MNGQVDPSTLAVDDDLLELLGDAKSKKWFLDRLHGDAETLALALQKTATELADQAEKDSVSSSNSSTISNGSSRSSGSDSDGSSWARSQLLVRHLETIGWHSVVGINAELTELHLRCWDEARREHSFEVTVPAGYPIQSPTVQASLPEPVTVPWPHRGAGGDLALVLHAMSRELARLQGFFQALDDLDARCWILDPAQPSYAVCMRRIAVDKTCSVVIDVRPEDPRGVCEVRFLGPPAIVQPLQAHLGQHVGRWRAQALVRDNLEAVLGVSLPLRTQQAGGESYLLECGICYSYTLTAAPAAHDGPGDAASAIPDQVCPNQNCGRVYHNVCLVDWLQSVPSSRSSFGTTFGACPYCGGWLSTKSVFA